MLTSSSNYAINVSRMKWKPCHLTPGERFVSEVLTTRSAQDRANLTNFKVFVALNQLEGKPFEEKIALIAAQMRSHDLKGTTIVSYLHSITSQIHLSQEEYRKTKRVISAMEFMCRHDEIRRAPELTSGQLELIVQKLACPFVKVAVELMYATALRAGDLNDIAPHEVTLLPKLRIRILIVGGKNHRKFSQRDVLETEVSTFVYEYLRRVKQSLAPRILNVSATEISTAISKVLATHLTSYSIRNLRIYEIIRSETDESGITDWTRVAATTKHRGFAALKSAYHWKKS